MRDEDIREAFQYFINTNQMLDARKLFKTNSENKRKSDEFLESHKSNGYIDSINVDFIRNNIISFIRTFYKKSPSSFKTSEYREICQEFNKRINNEIIENKIKLIVEFGKLNEEDFLPSGDLYQLINFEIRNEKGKSKKISIRTDNIFVNTDDATSLTAFMPNEDKARVYINPSSQDFINFVKYINSRCIENEIMIDHKIRYTHNGSDRIIYYVPINELGNFLNILNQYEKEHPNEIKEYNSPPTLLAKNTHDWYGYGHMGAGGGRNATLNDYMECIMNFAFLMLFINNYNKIGYAETNELISMLENVFETNYSDIKSNKISINFFDISNNVKERLISSSKQCGREIIDTEGVYPYVYMNTKIENWKKLNIGNIREKFNKYCKEHFDNLIAELSQYIKIIQEQIDYLDNSNIYLSSKMAKEIEKKKNIVFDFLQLMNNKQYCYNEDDVAMFNEELNNYFNKVGGLDNVILALEYCSGMESLNPEILSLAQQYIDDLCRKRAVKIIQERKPISELSRYELDDVNNLDIISLDRTSKKLDNDLKKYDLYRSIIDTYSDKLNDELLALLETSINKNMKNGYFQRKILQYMYEKAENKKKNSK